ncbi:hypothetical protein [Dankookia sp. P2]|uniref:hypothetical protein n=1 Tax=Dankookia sp. P2 TaxID=3423955 RepID=UPI003D668C2A
MIRTIAAALAAALLLPVVAHAQPQDCGSVIARDPQPRARRLGDGAHRDPREAARPRPDHGLRRH